MRYSELKPIGDRYGQNFQSKRISLYAGRKRFGQSRIPIGARVEVGEFAMAAYHEKQIADSGTFEILAQQKPGTECRVSDQDAIRVDPFHDDEVTVAVVRDQGDGGNADLRQGVERGPHAVGLLAARLEEALHVEEGKALRSYLCLIPGCEHRREYRSFTDRPIVLERQQRGHRGGAATEVILLMCSPFEGAQQLDLFDGVNAYGDVFECAGLHESRILGRRAVRHRGSRQADEDREQHGWKKPACHRNYFELASCRFKIVEF